MVYFKNSLFSGMLIFSIFYSLLYIMRDIYYLTKDMKKKKFINKLLPFFTRYNVCFLIFLFLFLILEFYNSYISSLLFSIIFLTITLSFILIFFPIKNFNSTKYLNLISYILIIEVIFIYVT